MDSASTWWSREQREFCVEQYYLNQGFCTTVRRLFCEKYKVVPCDMKLSCPTANRIRHWVAVHEGRQGQHTLRAEEEERRKQLNKLNGTQWGRKTGENRIVRTESIDMGELHQAIKWKQRDTKWSGPRPVNEKQKIEVPVVEEHPCWWYQRRDSVEEEVKPDKKQVLKEKFEGEVLELIEALDAHGHAARASAFDSLRAALQRRVVEDLLAKHRATLADHVSRALRRGKDGERKAAAAIAPLLAIQIGDEGMDQFVREVRPALIATATDFSASLDTRTECCSSLAVLCYLMDEDISETLEAMRMYETIFSGSYLKDDGSVRVSGAAVEEGALHAAALDGWALLFSLLSSNHALSLLNNQDPSFDKLGELLEAPSLEVRMAAGSALAIAYETATQDGNSNSLTAHVDALLPRLTELARDSNRFHAKRDRRVQRATFRHILKYFEDGEAPSTSVHIGRETAEWSSWSGGAAYAALATALGGALPVLAPHYPRLRAALQLSEEPPEVEAVPQDEPKKLKQDKPKKLQRHLQNRAASKARDFTRNQNRDKRSAVLAV
ncbi:hypothetical protein PYW07_015634 [Mythimna separata]|uniref:Interferon-related developmental regulator 1 n=1 Tax=Mythimna separata TaxID=271217 RepID=A0AAD8DYM8_MYTSE|nr:hypothetical protein PYW07_015634 [Mythimna separata]